MIKQPEIDFNWSYTKYKLFQYCERAYFFQYLSSEQNNPNHRNIALEKNLISKELWINKIIKAALISTIKTIATDHSLDITNLLKDKIFKTYNLDKFYLITKKWEKDPKILCLTEIYHKNITIDELLAWAQDTLNRILTLFLNPKLLNHIKSIPYQAFKDTGKPLFFNLSKYKVWCSPELLWESEKNLNIFNCVFNIKNQDWAYLAAINTLYAVNIWHYPIKNIICETIFFDIDNESQFKVYSRQSLPETKQIILDSIEAMLSRLTYDGNIYIENFPKTDTKEKCLTCKYKLTCQAK